jgi:hypothetical protein
MMTLDNKRNVILAQECQIDSALAMVLKVIHAGAEENGAIAGYPTGITPNPRH